MKSNRVIRIFQNADLRGQHDGLSLAALEHKIDCKKLKPGEFVVFINRKQDRAKVYATNNVVAFMKHPENRRLDLQTIRYIPRVFNGGAFAYDDAWLEMSKAKK